MILKSYGFADAASPMWLVVFRMFGSFFDISDNSGVASVVCENSFPGNTLLQIIAISKKDIVILGAPNSLFGRSGAPTLTPAPSCKSQSHK